MNKPTAIWMFDTELEDVAEYTCKSPNDVLEEGSRALVSLAEDWLAKSPDTLESIQRFYEQADAYIYDLARWHHTIPERRDWTTKLLEVTETYGIHTVLDWGCGLGVDGLTLAVAGLSVTLADLDCGAFEFAKWRAAKYELPVRFHTLPQPLDSSYDLIICFDVLEHLGSWWPQTLKQLLTRSRILMALAVPFQSLEAPNEYQPQHFPEGQIPLMRYMIDLGWKQSTLWPLLWMCQ